MEKHLSYCPRVEYECELCSQKVIRSLREEHQTECPMVVIECSLCHEQFKRKDLDEHRNVCPEQEIACMKCDTVMKRRELESHDCLKTLKAITVEQGKRIASLEKNKLEYDAKF